MKSKPDHYGIKIWANCENPSRYVWNLPVYTGQISFAPEKKQGQRVVLDLVKSLGRRRRRRRRRRLKRYPLQVRHKQDWGRGFILLLPQTAALPGSDAGSDVIVTNFVRESQRTS